MHACRAKGRQHPRAAAALELELRARASRARIRSAFNLTLARRALPLARGQRRVRLRPSRRLIGRPRRFRDQLIVTATDAAGDRRVVRRTITVRR